jgi:hypothetical protein
MERVKRSEEMNEWRSAHILASVFINRWDLHAVQLDDGRYICVKEPLQGNQLVQHLRGEITLGAYALDENDETKFAVIDADDDVQYYQLFGLADSLADEGIPSYMEQSRRGGHLWFLFEQPVAGERAKRFAEEALAEYHIEPMEVFPKQSETRGGPGSLIRLPFGTHRKSGNVYPFVRREDGLPIAAEIHEQILELRNPQTVDLSTIDWYLVSEPRRQTRVPISEDNVWERIRQSKPAIDFIGRYIELAPTSTGGVGYCPFHEDEVRSLSVHREGNYWHCFAGCGGGSIIDFWMKWKGLSLGEATKELREMLEVE